MLRSTSLLAALRLLVPDARPVWLASGLLVGLTAAAAAPLLTGGVVAVGVPSEDALWHDVLESAATEGQEARALALLDAHRAAHPDSPHAAEALRLRAGLHTRLGQPARAAAAWEALATHAPDAAGAARLLLRAGDAWVVAGQRDAASHAYTAATTSPPTAATAWLGLGRLRLEEDPAAAHDAYQAALHSAQRPATARLARLGKATALERLEGWEAALAEVDEALAEGGADPALERRLRRLQAR